MNVYKRYFESDLDLRFHRFEVYSNKRNVVAAYAVTLRGARTDSYKKFDKSLYGIDSQQDWKFNKYEIIAYVNIYKAGGLQGIPEIFYGSGLFVEPSYRRQGIATKLYDFIERDLNVKLTPEFKLSDDGSSFWKSRKQESYTRYFKEEFIAKFPTTYQDVKIYKNPTVKDLSEIPSWTGRYKTLRALTTINGDLYVWDAYIIHRQMIDYLEIWDIVESWFRIEVANGNANLEMDGGSSSILEKASNNEHLKFIMHKIGLPILIGDYE